MSFCVTIAGVDAALRLHRHMHDLDAVKHNRTMAESYHHRGHHHQRNASHLWPNKSHALPTKSSGYSASVTSKSLKLTLINANYPATGFQWPNVFEDNNRNSNWNLHSNVPYQPAFYATPAPAVTTVTTTTTVRPFKDPRVLAKHHHG